jgi:hypothetical protein
MPRETKADLLRGSNRVAVVYFSMARATFPFCAKASPRRS